VLVIPHFFFAYSHNLFLDVALEQGIFGVLAFLAIFITSFWLLIRGKQFQNIHWAILASLLVIALHGLLDDALYGEQGTPLLFLSFGLALALTQPQKPTHEEFSISLTLEHRKKLNWGLMAEGIVIIVFLFLFRNPILASLYADFGAVQMARVELVGFPTGRWEEGNNLESLATAKRLFDRAIRISPNNRTAYYRLGLIAMLRQDYPDAISNLETAYFESPANRGIRKNLGYSYVWAGKFNQATNLLKAIPETRNEMDAYTWWWGTQGRDDLAANAVQVIQFMDSSVNSSGTILKP
jgi:tetratricopeptide (TPR) repeat protein